MTDKELLEFAAKAAGFEYNGVWFDERTGLLVWEPPTNYESREWNPLTDDGDALRLAVTLGLFESIDFHFRLCEAQNQDDPHAATRLTITRAAAEIGRNMK